jgi:asparagine synthase (glutamine-hydrolysing)
VCGVAGFAGIDTAGESPLARLKRMCDAIYHRGPDCAGYFVQPGIAMGMRRLSIIDISGGRQPICNEDGTVNVVFNGEIYNHHELRARLERAGHRFSTRCDTEVLVHLYEECGLEMVEQLHGMFAFSIWDATRSQLLLARDRTGMKPLSYFEHGGGIEFCSELRSLWAADSSALRIQPAAVMQYLAFGYVPDPLTIFAGVRKVPPGHLLTWSAARGISVRRYWHVSPPSETEVPEEDLIHSIRSKLDKAVASHLESEVPLGAFLSGGLDSSTVVALMAKHAQGRVRTFSIGFAEEEYDESAAARVVAEELGTEHTELVVKPNVEAIFDSVASMFDEPFADSSAIATFLVAQLAKQQVTVALSGDGGDELFGGYTRYRSLLARGSNSAGALRSSIEMGSIRCHGYSASQKAGGWSGCAQTRCQCGVDWRTAAGAAGGGVWMGFCGGNDAGGYWHVPARRYPDKGGSNEYGGVARGACAVAGRGIGRFRSADPRSSPRDGDRK